MNSMHETCDLINGDNEGKRVIFDKYEIGRLLGHGTFAKVYHGRIILSGDNVAIKVIDKDQMVKNKGMIELIKREISIMRMVRHPNVVEIKEVMATKKKIFFVMEYVCGGELFDKVSKGRLHEETARKYFQQLISAVDFCHSRGVAHRDLKPENLLLDEDNQLKISDFGLSALPENLRNDGLLHTQCGTPAYVAPEVLQDKGYDGFKADIWSCGVILYALLAGFLPFLDENIMIMYTKIFKAECKFPPWVSIDSRRLICKLLVPDPTKRISIPEIMQEPWFLKGFTRSSINVPIQNDDNHGLDDLALELKESKPSRRFYNAFKLISSMSSGFNLFEEKKKSESIFTKCSANSVMEKLEAMANDVNFNIVDNKNYSLKMQRVSEGRKGKLSVKAEVFEISQDMAAIEFSKDSGDTLEYKKFCDEDVRLALKDIVWS